MWLGESEVARSEARMVADGMPPRDLYSFRAWREQADPENLDLIEIYSSYLQGQYAGMTDALSLEAVRAAMDILDVSPQDRPEMARRLIFLHGLVREIQRPKEKEGRG